MLKKLEIEIDSLNAFNVMEICNALYGSQFEEIYIIVTNEHAPGTDKQYLIQFSIKNGVISAIFNKEVVCLNKNVNNFKRAVLNFTDINLSLGLDINSAIIDMFNSILGARTNYFSLYSAIHPSHENTTIAKELLNHE